MLSSGTKPEQIDRRRSLASIPVVNDCVSHTIDENGRLQLTIEIQRGSGFLSRFQPRIMKKRVRLDELGVFVFEQIDGKRTVKAIIEAFTRRFRTDRRESELSVAAFLKSLAQRRVISIVVK
ncbi:MAG: PqqD family protein [Lentisphaeria bacterium]|jgi:hypothetical protein|nr:PqqD family protein [Lentisphaeria bacterium]